MLKVWGYKALLSLYPYTLYLSIDNEKFFYYTVLRYHELREQLQKRYFRLLPGWWLRIL